MQPLKGFTVVKELGIDAQPVRKLRAADSI